MAELLPLMTEGGLQSWLVATDAVLVFRHNRIVRHGDWKLQIARAPMLFNLPMIPLTGEFGKRAPIKSRN